MDKQMPKIKLIKNSKDHSVAMKQLRVLLDEEKPRNEEINDEIEILALLIESYEEKNFPMDKPDPIEAIKFRMDQMGLKQKDIAEFIGSKSKVSEVLNGKIPLSIKMIRRLHYGLGIPAETLIQEPNLEYKVKESKD